VFQEFQESAVTSRVEYTIGPAGKVSLIQFIALDLRQLIRIHNYTTIRIRIKVFTVARQAVTLKVESFHFFQFLSQKKRKIDFN
jgi:hypothetical protein